MGNLFNIRRICAATACVFTLAAHADIITVAPEGGDHTTLEAAVAAASNGDEIVIADGNYTRTDTGLFIISKALDIRSANGRDAVSISGLGTGDRRGFHVSNALARVAGITFRSFKSNVYTPGYATGLEISGGTVSNCVVSNCTMNVGSAVKVRLEGSLEDSLVCGNVSSSGGVDRKGAGIYIGGGQVRNCEIRNNRSAVGAGIDINGSTARVSGCHIHGNSQNGQILTASGKTVNGYGGGCISPPASSRHA